MTNMLYWATKYMNAENVMIVKEGGPKKWEKYDDPHLDKGRKVAWTSDRKDEWRSWPSSGWIANFSPLNTLLIQVLIRDNPALTWPNKLKSNPNKRLRNNNRCFHRDHSHDAFDCYDLKQKIKALIRHGKLQRFIVRERAKENPPRDQESNRQVEEWPRAPLGEIRMIVRGSTMVRSSRKTYLRMVQNVQLIGCSPKLTWMDDPMISFTEEDAWRVHHPYENSLVINLTIANFNTRRVLVDNGSLADFLYYPTF